VDQSSEGTTSSPPAWWHPGMLGLVWEPPHNLQQIASWQATDTPTHMLASHCSLSSPQCASSVAPLNTTSILE